MGNGGGFYIDHPKFNVEMVANNVEAYYTRADLSGGFFYVKRG